MWFRKPFMSFLACRGCIPAGCARLSDSRIHKGHQSGRLPLGQPSPGVARLGFGASSRAASVLHCVASCGYPTTSLKMPQGMSTEPMGRPGRTGRDQQVRRTLFAFPLIWPFADEPNDSSTRSTCGDRGELRTRSVSNTHRGCRRRSIRPSLAKPYDSPSRLDT